MKYNITIKNLIILFLVVGIGFFTVEITKQRVPTSFYHLQIEAAQIMIVSLQAIQEEKELRGIPIDEKTDPNKTGLIGEEYTRLTTTLGNLDAKRTSTNSDFAALMVKYFKEAGLESGDVIAIGSSGSFPALIIATLSACKVMEINPLIIYAIGASEYGATIPDFTFIEMLETLNHKGILPYQLLAVSMGGDNDQAGAMFYPDSHEVIRDIAKQSDSYFIDIDNLADNIQSRMELYQKTAAGKTIKLFVNIGGASANYGNTTSSITYPNGLVLNGPEIPVHPERGLIFEYQALGLPVIHLLNIRDLAFKNGIPIDPIPFPPSGQSSVYFVLQYQKWVIVLTILIGIIYLVQARRLQGKEV